MSTKKLTARTLLAVRVDRDLLRRFEVERKRVEVMQHGPLPAGTLARVLIVEALDARAASNVR